MAPINPRLQAVSPLCRICPRCGAEAGVATVLSSRGAYCRCVDCGHVWHVDEASRSGDS